MKKLARFLDGGPDAKELERVKTQYVAGFIRGVDRIGGFGGKSDVLAAGQAFLDDPAAYKVELQRVESATVQDLKSAARRWLSDGVYILEVHPFPDYKTATQSADRSKMPETGTPPELKLPKLERATLSNGLQVILAQRHEIPVVDFRLQVDAGYAADQFASPGTASLATALLDGGTEKRTALEISEEGPAGRATIRQLRPGFIHRFALRAEEQSGRFARSLRRRDPASGFSGGGFPAPTETADRRDPAREIDAPFHGLRVLPALLYGAITPMEIRSRVRARRTASTSSRAKIS